LGDLGRKHVASLEQIKLLIQSGAPHFAGAQLAVKVMSLINEGASAANIESEVSKLPTLASSLVRLASSPAFGSKEISDVRFAIELLGYKELYRIMMTLAMSSLSNDVSRRGMLDEEAFRKRAITTGFICEDIARKLYEQNVEEFYLAGLFQDIGYLFLAIHNPVSLMQVKVALERTPGIPLTRIEDLCLGFCHAQLSAAVAEQFELPERVVQGIRYHHEPDNCPEEARRCADIARIASWVVESACLAPVPGIRYSFSIESSLERTGLETGSVLEFADRAIEKGIEVTSIMMGEVEAA